MLLFDLMLSVLGQQHDHIGMVCYPTRTVHRQACQRQVTSILCIFLSSLAVNKCSF